MASPSKPPSLPRAEASSPPFSGQSGSLYTGREGSSPNNLLPGNKFPGLSRIVSFFGIVVVLAFGLDAIISHGLRQIRTSKFGSMNHVMSGEVNADIVINGSSRALVHYDPRIIQQATGLSAYNLGMNGVQIDVQLAVLKAYLKRNRKPKIVIQNLESFSFVTTKPGEIYDPAVFLPYLSEDVLYTSLRGIDPAVGKWKHIPLYGYVVEDMTFTWARGLLGVLGHSGPETYFRGFNPRQMRWTEDFEQYRASVGPSGVTNQITAQGTAALRELIGICKDAGIEVILAYSPVYHEMQALEKNRAEVFSEFERQAREFQIQLWDFSTSPICRQQDYFYNSQHLNASGAALFSAAFAERLREFRIQKPRGTSEHFR